MLEVILAAVIEDQSLQWWLLRFSSVLRISKALCREGGGTHMRQLCICYKRVRSEESLGTGFLLSQVSGS